MKRILFVLLISLCIGDVYSQSLSPKIVSSAGATYQASTMQIDWTLGELAVTSIQNSDRKITQGFHQPSYTVSNINELSQKIGQIKVFPNPTTNGLEIQLNFEQSRNVRIQLFDLQGKLIKSKNKQGQQISQQMDLSQLTSGHYFLNFLIDENQFSQTFKIQKLK